MATLVCAALLGPAGAQGYVINVTTTDDEFNTDLAECSLREAVQVANDASATTPFSFGGCTSANDPLFPLDVIQLPHPAYTLTLDGVDDTNAAGDLDILNEGVGLLGQNMAGPSTIDGGTSDMDSVDDRVIDFHPSAANGATQDLGLTGLVITGGTTTGAGGGVRINGPPAMGETITADLGLLTVTGNTATSPGGATPGLGGGIENQGGEDVDIAESTISGNSAAGSGGGVDTQSVGADPADTQFENVTVSNNTADSDGNGTGNAGGVAARLAGASGTFYNTIVAENIDGGTTALAPDCGGDATLSSGGYNLVGTTSNCTWTAGVGDLLNVPAGLAPLAPIPGVGLSTVLAHDLLPGSLAREAGHPGTPGSADPFTCGVTAQNSVTRPRGPRCDIGSIEAVFVAAPAGSGGGALTAQCDGRTATVAGARATISGTAGADTISGTSGPDVIDGAGGNDTIRGLGGNDRICGDEGKDTLVGGGGKDRLLGGAGKDKLKGGGGKDTCIGAGARDTAATCEKAKSL